LFRRAVVEIDLKAIGENLKSIKKVVGPQTKILLPVKADAYGHGIIPVSKFTEKNNLVDMFGVASFEEAILLRDEGIKKPILILGLIIPQPKIIDKILDNNISLTVADLNFIELLAERATAKKKFLNIHLKVDTGMGRIGCQPEEALDFIHEILKAKYLNLEGIFSHLAVADQLNSDFTLKQLKIFQKILGQLAAEKIEIPCQHLANSAALVNYPATWFDMVRPGLMSYGYQPSVKMAYNLAVTPAMTFKSEVVFLKKVKAGVPLSYGLTFASKQDTNIATVPVGYGDGYSRFLSNLGRVLIANQEYPVVGRVTMDQILVDLGHDDYPIGQEVILFGQGEITANSVADWIRTIPYDITCGISKRVPRLYYD